MWDLLSFVTILEIMKIRGLSIERHQIEFVLLSVVKALFRLEIVLFRYRPSCAFMVDLEDLRCSHIG